MKIKFEKNNLFSLYKNRLKAKETKKTRENRPGWEDQGHQRKVCGGLAREGRQAEEEEEEEGQEWKEDEVREGVLEQE